MKRIGVVFILVLAFCGLADSIYLAQHEISGTPLICNVQHLSDCNIVANSPYAYLFGVPLSEYGVLFYAMLFVLAALELVLFDRILRRVIQGIAVLCLLASIYFEAVQIFFIGAFCIYCLASALITLVIFIFATLIEPMRAKQDSNTSEPSVAAVPEHLSIPPAA